MLVVASKTPRRGSKTTGRGEVPASCETRTKAQKGRQRDCLICLLLLIMRKIEIVSLVLLASVIVVLVVALQMDYGDARKWLTWLSFGLMVLAIDPRRHLQLWRKKEVVEEQEEPEESGPGYISLCSEVPVSAISDREKWLGVQDVYLKFLDIESDDYYYMHFVAGKAAETYVGGAYYLENQDFDELFEDYETLEELLQCADKEEIEDLSIICADDFVVVRNIYQKQQALFAQQKKSEPIQVEPVNRVGKVVAYLLVVSVVICIGWKVVTLLCD